jgi:hypothetical protein
MSDVADSGGLIDPVYLPLTAKMLKEKHFAEVRGDLGGGLDPDRHLTYYLTSAANRANHDLQPESGAPPLGAHEKRRRQQMEKDERFWVVGALASLYYYHDDPVGNFAEALEIATGGAPKFGGYSSWAKALGKSDDLHLFFEVNLPSPPAYSQLGPKELEQHLDEHLLNIPHLLRNGVKAAKRKQLEGATKVDAVLISGQTNVAVLFEAKVLADISCGTSYDISRNQMVRNIDVMLETNSTLGDDLKRRDPAKTCFVLLTPEAFRQNGQSRLYGWLYDEYKKEEAGLLKKHLGRPDRPDEMLATVPSRLGWLTWEDCRRIDPTACRWLEHPNHWYATHIGVGHDGAT